MAFRFEGLQIWYLAREYATLIYAMTASFPRYERFALADQLNRAVNSVALNIAEGSGQDSDALFNRYLGIATGSVCEVVGGLFLAHDRAYIDDATHADLLDKGDHLIRAIANFRKTLLNSKRQQ